MPIRCAIKLIHRFSAPIFIGICGFSRVLAYCHCRGGSLLLGPLQLPIHPSLLDSDLHPAHRSRTVILPSTRFAQDVSPGDMERQFEIAYRLRCNCVPALCESSYASIRTES